MPTGDDGDDFDPELDLLDRYERMIEIQVETINGIDEKAAHTGRLIAILAGLILTAVSIGVSTDAIVFSEATVVAIVMLAVGSLALFVSLVFAIITYLSSRFLYGPTAGIGEYMAKYRVDSQQYRDALLSGYSKGISSNKQVVEENSRRFKYCLASLLVALLLLFGSGSLFVLPDHLVADAVVLLVFGGSAAFLAQYIVREEYLTLDDVSDDNE